LYRKHDIDCCRRGFNRRADGVCHEEFLLEPTENIKQTKLEEGKMKLEQMESKTATNQMNHPPIVPEAEWLVARKDLLTREKDLTRLRDEVSKHRRALPWVKVDKEYLFYGQEGKETLADLFDGRRQLIVYHFMFGPGWEEGCKSCSYLADHFDGANWHLPHRDVTFVVVSRAPLSEFEPYKKRMGWRFEWVSSHGSDFNFDYHVSFAEDEVGAEGDYNYENQEIGSDEMPGASVFYKDADGAIFHTYSAYARGLDILIGAYNLLDLTPKGRDEAELPWTMAWVRRHDEYEDAEKSRSCCSSEPRAGAAV
jgi:predicted dithiol-disulfide oxidoreductase (DUF899 family)